MIYDVFHMEMEQEQQGFRCLWERMRSQGYYLGTYLRINERWVTGRMRMGKRITDELDITWHVSGYPNNDRRTNQPAKGYYEEGERLKARKRKEKERKERGALYDRH
jgi:hypothetical protein